jgi:hypothetical protein
MPVFGAGDRKTGSVQQVMIDKISGKVAYAVIVELRRRRLVELSAGQLQRHDDKDEATNDIASGKLALVPFASWRSTPE